MMDTLKFKTNIKCSGCIAATTPFLNKAAGEGKWKVDTDNPDKILTVETGNGINEKTVIEAVQQAGYTAEKLN